MIQKTTLLLFNRSHFSFQFHSSNALQNSTQIPIVITNIDRGKAIAMVNKLPI